MAQGTKVSAVPWMNRIGRFVFDTASSVDASLMEKPANTRVQTSISPSSGPAGSHFTCARRTLRMIASGEENGTISVNGAAVAIKGLAALAYKSEITEDELGEALKASIAAKATKADLNALTVRVGDIEKAGYQTAEQVQAAIAASGHAHFEVAETDPTAEGFAAQANVMYLYMNSKTKHYDIYAKVGESVVLLDDTTVDLSEYAKTADVTSAISTAIAALNIDQYATDEDLTAAVARVTAIETAVANVYTKKEVDDKLAAKMDKASMDAYATDEEAQQAAATAVAGAQASDTEFNAAMNEVWTPTEG